MCLLAALPVNAQYTISTLAGNGNAGYGGDNGPATEALLNKPRGIAVDSAGNVYIADQLTNRIRKVDSQGNITTVAGGSASAAAKGVQLNSPAGVAVDASGNLYIADQLSNTIRMIDAKGNLSTIAGGGSEHIRTRGIATDALLNGPAGIAVDATGRVLIAESGNHAVTAVSESGRISTISDQVNDARAVAVDAAGNIYVADTAKSRILKIDMTGVVTTMAGDGKAGFEGDGGAAADAQLSNPQGVAVDAAGNLYIADTGNNRIRKVSSTGLITTIAGTGTSGFSGDGGRAADAQLSAPMGIAVDTAGNLYVADAGNERVRALTLIVSTDFDHNGVPDLIWQNDTSSQVTVHYYGGANGASMIGWAWVNQTGAAGWHVVAVADINKDGNPDLVWQNDITRQVTVNYYGGTRGTTYLGWNWLNQAGMPGWHVAGAADFNGDGYPDLVWQNDTTRAVSVSYYGGTGGAAMQSSAWLNQTGFLGWSVVAIADFNGDGVPDLVWQNDSTRQVVVHYFGGTGGATDQSWRWLDQAGVLGWHVKLAADFNGDGYPDLVFQNDTTRQVVVHYYGGTGGATYQTWTWLNQGSVPGWTVFNELPSTLNDNTIILPASVSVGYGQSTPFPVTLAAPAPSGGVTITLSSNNTAKLTIAPTSVFIAAGATTPATQPQATGAGMGSATISASATGYNAATLAVQVNGSMTFSPATLNVTGAGTQNLTLTLNGISSTQVVGAGFTVNLSSSNTSVATVPATAVFPASQTSITIPVTTIAPGNTTITASGLANFMNTTATVTVMTPGTLSFSPLSLSITGTATQNLTLTLSQPAPAGGLTVNVSSSNTAIARVPATATFAANATTVTVPVTGVVTGSAVIHASALPAVADTIANVSVSPAGTISIPANTTVGLGQSAAFAVTLSSPAPAGGITVTLTSSDASKVTVPPSILIPAGATTPATQPQVNGINIGSATITASAGAYSSASQSVQVTATISFSPAIATIIGTASQNLTLNLSAPAPAGGLTINLSSSNISVATVPATVTFAASATTTTVPVTGVTAGSATINASSLPGIANTTASITVQPVGGIIVPSSVTVGIGQVTPFNITLPAAAPAGGVSVTMSSSNTTNVTVFPSSVAIPAGATQPATQPQVAGVSLGSASITASAPGYTSGSQTVQVTASISFTPTNVSITGPTVQNITLTLSTPAPAGGQVINLSSSNNGVATIPATVTFPANAVTVNVPVTGVSVGTATIHASALPNIPDTTANVTVIPAGTITIPTNATVGLGQSATFPVTISNPAVAGGVTIMLGSSDTSKVTIAPASIFIAAGATAPTTQPTITGINFGLATINAVAAGYTAASQQVQTTASISFSPAAMNITGPQVQNLTLTLSAAAPAGGLTINLTSTNPTTATVPATVTFGAGTTTVTVPVTGVSIGSTVIHGSSSPNVPDTTATVNVVSAGTIGLPTNTSVAIGQSTPYAVTLPVPAPAGGVTVALTSSDTTKVTVSAASVSIAAGATTPATQPTVTAVSIGSASITASASGFTSGTQTVQTTASVSFAPGSMTITGLNTQNITLNLSAPAPAGGLTVSLSSSNGGVATVPATATFAQGSSSITVPVSALTLGSTVLHANALPNIADSTATVNILSGGAISLPTNVSLGLGQSTPFAISLPTPAPATGVTVTLTSNNSAVSVTSSVVIAGGATIPATQPQVVGASVGSASITATAPGYTTNAQTVQVTASIGFSPNSLTIVGPTTQNLTLTLSGPAPAAGLTVNLSSNNPAVATVPATVTFAAGATSVSVPVTGVAVGSTTINASATAIANTAAAVNVTTAGGISLQSNVTVGLAHSAALTVTLPQAAPAGGVTVTLTSSDTTKATVSQTVFITAGATTPATQPLVSGINLGTVTITASAPAYTTGSQTVQVNATVSFSPSSVTITGPTTQNLTLTLSGAAPASGLTINLSSDNTGAATVPSTVSFAAGATSATVPVTGVSIGTANIHANLLPNIADSTAGVTIVTGGPISAPSNVSVGLAHSAAFPISLPSAAPAGGVTVTLNSSNTSEITVAPMTVFIAAGATTPTTQPSVNGINLGSANITASAPGFTSSTQAVTVGATLTFSPSAVTVTGPGTDALTLTLSGAAPAGGLTVNLSSSNTSVATVPATVTFPSAATSVTVNVSAISIGSTTISASALPNIAATTASVTIASGGVINLPVGINVGLTQSVSYPVVLPIPAPAGGTTVLLSSSASSTVSISPSSVVIPAGAQVPVTQPQVTALNFGSANITAAAPGFTAGTQTVQVTATASCVPATLTITGATTQTLTLTLSAPAPSGGLTMNLSSSNTSVATVPATATFVSGATTANVQVTGVAVGSTVISASSLPNVAAVTANVTVQSQIILASNVTLGLGKTANFQVSLVSPAGPSGAFVSLSSSNSSVVSISPSSFFINQGNTTGITPQVTGVANGSATITATIYGDLPATQSVQVINATIAFSPNTTTIVGNGTESLALTLSTQAPAGGLTVNLSSNNTSVATVPATATFPANSTSTSVPITGVNPGTAVITASALPNIAAVTATATVVAPGSIVLPSFYSVGLLQTTPFPVTLGTAAPAGGLTVTLTLNDSNATVTPLALTFPAGSTTPTTTPQVYGAVQGYTTVTATAPGYTTASLQIHISDGIRINLPPAVTVGLGQSASYTVILDSAAPAGGTTISLSSTNPSVVSVSATAFVPQGATQPTTQPTVTGLNVGSAQINASASGYTSASPQTVTVNATMSFTPATLSVAAATTQNATLTLSGPAPTGGLTINLLSGNTSVATVPSSVTFAAGATTVAVPVTGVGTGSATITASTTAPNIPSTTLSVTGTSGGGMILLPANTSVVLGQSVAFPITLPSAAPVGGVTVTLSSANSSLATVTSSVTIAAGATQPATQPQVTGVNLGAVNINASAPGYTSAVQQVQVGASLSFTPNTVTIPATSTQSLTLALSAAAPTGGLTVNLSSNNTSVATVPSPVTIPAGTISVSVPVTAGVTTGNATIMASTTAPNVPSTTAAVTVTSATILGAINVSNVSVGQGLENSLNITVTTAPTSDLQVTITSQNPANALVAGRVADPGATSITATLSAGSTTLGGIYVQGLQASGNATITVTAPNYTSGSATATLAKSGFVIAGPGGIGTSTLPTSQGLTSTITVSPARLDSSLNFVEVENIAGGSSATVNVANSNTTVGTISVSPVTINGGTNSATTTFNALAAGTTTLSASASGYSTPAQDASVTANVTAASIVTPNVTVGKNLEAPVSVTLNGATSVNNTTVTVTSSSPGTMLLSTTGTDSGFATITLNIPYAGLTHVPTFYVYGLANTGTATYTIAISGFPSASGTVTLQPSGVILFGPNGPGQLNFTTTTAAANSTITLYSSLLDPSNNYVQPMALAGNQSVTVNVTSANTSIGVITSSPVTIAGTTDSITTQFQPTAVGSSPISVSVPAGYNTPNQDTSVTAVVTTPGIAVSNNVTVGMNLEAGGLVSIGAAAATDTVVTLTSNNAALLLLAVNPTDTGSTSIQVTIPAGSTSATYYLIGLASSGSATYTGSAPNYGSRNGTVNLAPSGVAIVGPLGLGLPFFQSSIAGGATPLTVYAAQLNPTNNDFAIQQQVPGTQGLTVTLNDTNLAVGNLPATVTIAGGASTAVVQFTPIMTGSATISIATPAGYTTCANNTTLTADVTQ